MTTPKNPRPSQCSCNPCHADACACGADEAKEPTPSAGRCGCGEGCRCDERCECGPSCGCGK